jgi:hypothetical protein
MPRKPAPPGAHGEPRDLARPLDLAAITAELAANLAGSEVSVRLTVGKPTLSCPDLGFTTVGPDDQDDEVERVVYPTGERYDIDHGDKITVRGTLRLIRHAEAKVNGVVVPAWTEIRVEQARAKPSR